VGQVQAFATHEAPVGQSLLSRQPGTHLRVVASQPKPGAQCRASTQSSGNASQLPRLQTWPVPHAPLHAPQLV
jgi:hypothetical protein